MNTNQQARYPITSIAMHWAMVLLIAAVYLCMELADEYPKGDPMRGLLKHWHFMLGLTVFMLVWLRLLFRFRGTVPPIIPAPPTWQVWLGKAMHLLLYGFMIAMPIGGWLALSAGDKVVPFYGLSLPHLIGPNKELAETIEDIHGTIGNIGYFLIGLHAAAGLYHHYLRRDNALKRMMA